MKLDRIQFVSTSWVRDKKQGLPHFFWQNEPWRQQILKRTEKCQLRSLGKKDSPSPNSGRNQVVFPSDDIWDV